MGSVRIRGTAGRLLAQTIDDLADFTVTAIGSARVDQLRVRVVDHQLPRGWIGAPEIHGLVGSEVRPRGRGVEVTLQLEKSKDIAAVSAAALRMISPVRGPRATFTSALPASAATLAPSVRDVYADDVHAHLRRTDTIVGTAIDDGQYQRHVTPQPDGHWSIDGSQHAVWVDPAVHRPFGRGSVPTGATTDISATQWLTSADIAELQPFSIVRGSPTPTVAAQMHAAGLLLESEVTERDPLSLQVASVQARRTALRTFTWPAALHAWPSVTAVLVTNRTTFLERIVGMLQRLDYPNLQIVVGLHGVPRATAALGAVDATVIEIPADVPFGAAMQRACAVAEGELLTKIDDDDIYGSQHIWDLVLARMYSGATIVGKALDWIYLADENATIFRPVYAAEKYAKFVAGGTMLISASDLGAVGGWRPVPRSIDRALLDGVRQAGGLVYRTHGLGYIYVRREDGHTARVDNAHFRTKAVQVYDGLIDHPEFT